MLLKKSTLETLIVNFEKRTSFIRKSCQAENGLGPNLSLYENASGKLNEIKKSLETLFHIMKELVEFSGNIKFKQKILLDFLQQNKKQILDSVVRQKSAIDLDQLIKAIETLVELSLSMSPTPQDYGITDFSNQLFVFNQWLADEHNLDFFTAIDRLNANYTRYYDFFDNFFRLLPEIALKMTLKSALKTQENANDAVNFKKILHEPSALFARFVVFLGSIGKYSQLLSESLKDFHDKQYYVQFKSLFTSSSGHFVENPVQQALENAKEFEDLLVSVNKKISRFNQRQDEISPFGSREAEIRFDLCQSNIIQPTASRKLEYKICCEYYQGKLDRLFIYLTAYENRCSDSFFGKHNLNGKLFSGKIKEFWKEKYRNAYVELQQRLANVDDFLPTFLEELEKLRVCAIDVLKQYDDSGSFSEHSGKNFVMAYINEIYKTVEHIKASNELPLNPDIEMQLKSTGSTDEGRKAFYDSLIASINSNTLSKAH